MPDNLYAAIDRHFLAPEALARVRHLGRAGRDADGWFKGELACLFAYPRPPADAWSEIMSAYARRIAPIAFQGNTALADYPPDLYIGKLTVTGGF